MLFSKTRLIFFLALGMLALNLPVSYAQTNIGTIEADILFVNQERPDAHGLVLKIYQDLSDTPYLVLDSISGNPYKISGLPIGHHYEVEVYRNGMYSGESYVNLKSDSEKTEIKIHLSVGVRLALFYNDGQTPINEARVSLTSHEGLPVGASSAVVDGLSLRFWIQPTTRINEYYVPEVSLDNGISYISSPIKVPQGGVIKIITPWPTIIDSLITVQLYDDRSREIQPTRETFVVELYDSKNNKVAESKVNQKGTAFFSMIKVDNYDFQVIKKEATKSIGWGSLKAIVDGNQKEIKIFEVKSETNATETIINSTGTSPNVIEVLDNHTNPSVKIITPSCNCVAFRLDDVQDHFLNKSQIQIMKLFEEKKTSLTLGIFGGDIGLDEGLTNFIKNSLANPSQQLEIANHGWSGHALVGLPKMEQETDIIKTNEKIKDLFGVTPKVFIPASNVFDNNTIEILKENGFTHISANDQGDPPPYFITGSTFYRFPSYPLTADLDLGSHRWIPYNNDHVFASIKQSLRDFGFAVVRVHPYEFSIISGTAYTGELNQTMLDQLGSLIDDVRADGLQIVPISMIDKYSSAHASVKTIEQESPPVTSPPVTSPPVTSPPPMSSNPDQSIEKTQPKNGCLIATAAFGSELSPQVQMLRETRDNVVIKTQSGAAFMAGFNSIYYSFAPTVANWERQNPIFKEIVKVTITPLITSLSLLNYANIDSEGEMLVYGMGIIVLNIGMYFIAPAILIIKFKPRFMKLINEINK